MDYLFGADGRFVTSKPTGWAWGPAELSSRFTIIRTDEPEFASSLGALERRELLLADKGGLFLGDNIFSGGALAPAPESEHVTPPAFINLRNGARHATEDDAWASAADGDVLFYTKSPNNPAAPGVAIIIHDVAARRSTVNRPMTIEEAQQCLS